MTHEDIPYLDTFKIVNPEPGVFILTMSENGVLTRKKITVAQLRCTALDAVSMALSSRVDGLR